MKGLLLKDLYTLKGFAKQYVVILGVMLVWSIAMKSPSFFIMYTLVLGSMLVLSTMGADETASVNRFALTMPISTQMLVKSKYLLLFITTGSGLMVSLLINALFHLIYQESEGVLDVAGIIGAVTVFVITNAIALPVMFKLSVEKARYVYITVMLVLTFGIVGGIKLLEMAGIPLETLDNLPMMVPVIVLLTIMIVAIIISYKISVSFVKKREW